MTRSKLLVLGVVAVTGWTAGCTAEGTQGDEGREAATGSTQQALSACPGNRAQGAGAVASGTMLWGGWQYITAGQRHFAKMVGRQSPGNADLYVYRNNVGYVRSATTSGSSTETIDWSPTVSDWYMVGAWGAQGADTVRFTSDVSDPAACGGVGTPVGFCFGAVGSNCDGVWPVAPCSTNGDATVVCQVSVGSQMHDTCCSRNPGGQNCGGSGNPSNYPSNCSSEWSHAQNDTTTTRQFPRTFDPTVPSYGPTSDMASWSGSNRNTATPTGLSIKTPVGKALWDQDAQNGWCASGAYNTYWSMQGYYSVCR